MTTRDSERRQVCHKHDALEASLARIEQTARQGLLEINDSLRTILADLRDGAVQMAEMRVKIHHLERWVYSAMGTALAGLVAAFLAMLFNKG